MELLNTKKGLAIVGVCVGALIAVLALAGNPPNMAICAACFIRDTAGSLKLHSAAPVQYFRPEIVGFVLGAFILSVATKEYRSTAGSSPMTRFVLGFIMMIGALIFLGCPLRMVIRMAAGDLNAWVGLIGLAAGAITGAVFLKQGFSLGRETDTNMAAGSVLPLALAVLFCLFLFVTATFASGEEAPAWQFAQSVEGPGSKHAPWILSLLIALVIGGVAQKTRICFVGGIRNLFLMKDFTLLIPIAGIFIAMLIYSLATGPASPDDPGWPGLQRRRGNLHRHACWCCLCPQLWSCWCCRCCCNGRQARRTRWPLHRWPGCACVRHYRAVHYCGYQSSS